MAEKTTSGSTQGKQEEKIPMWIEETPEELREKIKGEFENLVRELEQFNAKVDACCHYIKIELPYTSDMWVGIEPDHFTIDHFVVTDDKPSLFIGYSGISSESRIEILYPNKKSAYYIAPSKMYIYISNAKRISIDIVVLSSRAPLDHKDYNR